MSNGLKNTIIFVLGAAAGAAVTWKVLKTKYEQIVQEEIDSFKEMMSKKHGVIVNEDDESEREEELIKEYEMMTGEYSANTDKKGGSEPVLKDRDYITIIAPDEFAEDDDYDTESLIYYADEQLADDRGNLIEEIDDLVGDDFANYFGEFEDNAVYFRNDKYKTYYEVVRDYRRYGDIFEDSGSDLTADE